MIKSIQFNSFSIVLLLIISFNTYFLYALDLQAIDQILNIILSFGIFTYFQENNIKKVHNSSSSQIFFSFLLLFFTLYRSLWIFKFNDKFIYFLFPFLLISISLNFYSIQNFKEIYKPILLSFLFPIKQIIFIPISILMTPISTFATWFVMNCAGYKAIVKGSEVFFNSSGVDITFSCSGSDQILFSVFGMLVLNVCFPLKNLKTLLKQIVATIFIAFTVNILRLFILTLFVESANSLEFSLFDYLHGGQGSLIFSLITMILSCELFKSFYFKNNTNYEK